MNELIEKFEDIFSASMEGWEKWVKKHEYNKSCIIADPSRYVGLVDLRKIDFDLEWRAYIPLQEKFNKFTGEFIYDGKLFDVDFLGKVIKFLKETSNIASVEIARYESALLFKINEAVALAIAERITIHEFYYNDEGVLFGDFELDYDDDILKPVTIETEFVKWDGNVAHRKCAGKTLVWHEYIYKFENFFDEEEEMGDFLDL